MLGGDPPLPQGCTWEGANIQRYSVVVRYTCHTEPLAIELRHPSTGAGVAQTSRFVVVPVQGVPAPELVEVLTARLRQRETSFEWSISTLPPDPRSQQVLSSLRAFSALPWWHWLESVATAALAATSAWRLTTGAWTTRRTRFAAALLGIAFVLRVLVDWLPSNFYSDLPAAFPTYRYNDQYSNPLYDLAAAVGGLAGFARAPMAANVAIGAVLPTALWLALDGWWTEKRTPFLFALTVAAMPLYVRMSASDAPHMFGLFVFAVGAVHFRRAVQHGGRIDWLGFVAAAYLVGATRREIAFGPLMYLGLLFARPLSETERSRAARAALALIAAVGFGSTLTAVAQYERANAAVAPTLEGFLHHARSVLVALPMWPTFAVPGFVIVGICAVLVSSIAHRRFSTPALYCFGFYVLTLPYAFVPEFAIALANPTQNEPLSRYAIVWLLFPLFFSCTGWTTLLTMKWVSRSPLDLVIKVAVGGLLILPWCPTYFTSTSSQREYAFLRAFLLSRPGDEPMVTGWQKNAGNDLFTALAIPYYALWDFSSRSWITYPSHTNWRGVLGGRDEDVLVFGNTLGVLPAERYLGGYDYANTDAIRAGIASFHELRCMLENHAEPVYAWDDAAVRSPSYGGDGDALIQATERLTIYRVRAHTDTSAWRGCSAERSDSGAAPVLAAEDSDRVLGSEVAAPPAMGAGLAALAVAMVVAAAGLIRRRRNHMSQERDELEGR